MDDFRYWWVEGPEPKAGLLRRIAEFLAPSLLFFLGIAAGLLLADLLRGL